MESCNPRTQCGAEILVVKFRKGKLPQFPGNLSEHVWTLEFNTKSDRDEGAQLLKAALKYLQALKEGKAPPIFGKW